MAVVFDTSKFAPGDRADATCVAMQEQSVPSTVTFRNPSAVASRMEVWNYGTTRIFRTEMTGFRLNRTDKQIRCGPGDQLALAIHEQCTGKQEQYGRQNLVPPRQLMLMDLNAPYDYELVGPGSSFCLQVSIDDLALPQDVFRDAATRLPASPAYNVVVSHITELRRRADSLSTTSAAEALGHTSTDLARALIASAYDIDYARGMMAEVLLPRIRGYIRLHLSDPTMSPDSIAHAHDISVRKLFKLCEDAHFSLEQWIIGQRLAGASTELARPETRDIPIAVVARRWGFTNPSYFARRFRSVYGRTPKAWRDGSDTAV